MGMLLFCIAYGIYLTYVLLKELSLKKAKKRACVHPSHAHRLKFLGVKEERTPQ